MAPVLFLAFLFDPDTSIMLTLSSAVDWNMAGYIWMIRLGFECWTLTYASTM